MEALKLHWLGLPRVELKGRPAKLETRKSLALLAYLSMEGERCQRESLATLFWPEATQQRALGNLRRTLSSLNLRLPGWIESDRETIRLRSEGKLWSDLAAFRDLISRAKELPGKQAGEDYRSHLEDAVKLYRGDFLEGLLLGDAPQFDEWQSFQRDQLRRELADALERLSHTQAERGRLDQAVDTALRWAGLDPLNESACRTVMQLHARAGNRSAALRQYEELRRLLDEQQREVEDETRLLYEELRGPGPAPATVRPREVPAHLPILKTKLYIPAAPASRVERTALLDRLCRAEHYRLTLISAPAGFGKTTLLAEWIARTSLPVAWLSLDQGDNDPYRFLSYLIEALQAIDEGLGDQARQLLDTSQPAPPHIVLASLINDIGKSANTGALVLEDYQWITETAVHEAVTYLLDHLPGNLHVVIASRADPPLRLGRLRAHGQLLELRTHDLRFTAVEAAQFLNGVMALQLSEADIEVLEGRTEGWVVGLQLAAISLRHHERATEFIRDFSGSNRFILDYLVEEVLKRQPGRVQSFLLQTSILDKLSAPLCDALMNKDWLDSGENSHAVLEYLEQSNLFVLSLDSTGQWYRYHHLFADLLRSRVARTANADIADLHRKASAWYAANGLFAEAIEHALTAGDHESAARLVEQHAGDLVFMGRGTTAIEWIRRLPADLRRGRPWLSVWYAWAILASGTIEGVDRLIEDARAGLVTGRDQSRSLEHGGEKLDDLILGLEMTYASIQERHAETIALALQLLDRLPDPHSRHSMNAHYTIGNAYYSTGDLAHAERAYTEVRELSKGTWLLRHILATHRLASIERIEGRLRDAQQLYQDLLTSLDTQGQQDSFGMSYVYGGMAALCYEWGRLDEARTMLARSMQLADMTRVPMILVDGYSNGIPLLIGMGELLTASQLQAEAAGLSEKYPVLPETRDQLESCEARLLLAQADRTAVADWVESRKRRRPGPLGFVSELGDISLARMLISLGDLDAAGRLLDALAASAEAGGRNGRLVEIHVLQARVLRAQGHKRAAVASLQRSLELAEPGNYTRTYIDEGEWLRELLSAVPVRLDSTPTVSGAYLARLLGAFAGTSTRREAA